MDRNTVIGFVLIGIVLMVWMWLNAPPPQQQTIKADSTTTHAPRPDSSTQVPARPSQKESPRDTLGKYFSGLIHGEEKTVLIQTNLYRAEISTKGGNVKNWTLTGYKTWDQHPMNMISGTEGDFNLIFSTGDGKLIDTKNLFFISNISNRQELTVETKDSLVIDFILKISEKAKIVKSYIFYGDRYSTDVTYRFEGVDSIISNYEYQITWETGLRYAEHNSIDESNHAKAAAFSGGEITNVDASSFSEPIKQNISGRVNWVAVRNKYFAVAVIPREKESQGAYLEGVRKKMPDEGALEHYSVALRMPFRGQRIESDRFTLFLGPLDFDIVKQYNVQLDDIMSLGAAWIIRPISEYFIIPLFKLLRLVFSNYGIVLIVFSLIVKVALYPLTKTSMKSMRKMQALQPMIEELRAKHKEDPQKMNQQTMRLYKEYGVNPAGGCLPLLLQLPILYALWAVFSATIELRQASFVWWIHDLSIPDVITKIPFRLPIFNVDEISGLALMMGITTFIQQKMTVKDPRQKMMVWFMPIMLTLLFNSFPAGLNLYYFSFNLLSIVQQVWFNKQHADEPLRKVEEKKKSGGIIAKLSSNFPKMKK